MSTASPCIGECGIPQGKDYCRGCYRSRDEITLWRDLPDPVRQTILDRLSACKAAVCADSFENRLSAWDYDADRAPALCKQDKKPPGSPEQE